MLTARTYIILPKSRIERAPGARRDDTYQPDVQWAGCRINTLCNTADLAKRLYRVGSGLYLCPASNLESTGDCSGCSGCHAGRLR